MNITETVTKAHELGRKFPDTNARTRIHWARTEAQNVEPEGFNVEGDPFVVDGFTIKIEVEQDYYPDFSNLGTFTDKYEAGAIPNSGDSREYKWFVPAIKESEHFDGLIKMGMSKGVAHELARSYVIQDRNMARDYTSYIVTANALIDGVTFGSATLGGVEEGSVREVALFEGIIDEAIDEARKTLTTTREWMNNNGWKD